MLSSEYGRHLQFGRLASINYTPRAFVPHWMVCDPMSEDRYRRSTIYGLILWRNEVGFCRRKRPKGDILKERSLAESGWRVLNNIMG
jgi:hypothetical protein